MKCANVLPISTFIKDYFERSNELLLLIEDRIHNDKLVSVSAASCQITGLSEYY